MKQDTKQNKPLLITVDEAAEMLSLSAPTVYKLMREGTLPSVQIGRARRIPYDGLIAWIEQNQS